MQCNSIKPYRSYQPCYVFARWIFGCSCVQYGVCSRMVRKLIITRTPCTRNLHFSPPPPPRPPFQVCTIFRHLFLKFAKLWREKRAHTRARTVLRDRASDLPSAPYWRDFGVVLLWHCAAVFFLSLLTPIHQ